MLSLVAGLLGCNQQPQSAAPPASPQGPLAEETAADSVPGAVAERIPREAEKIAAEHLPNAWRLHRKVISGGLPEGDAGFKELADLGVKTVISVDGAKPDVATAKKYGLRYVHMPHGYDGVPELRAKELAKAVRDLPGAVYFHCHHGKHRSPAAATVACIGAGLLPPNAAVGVLKAAGTSENYRGLYQSVEAAKKLDDALLNELHVEYPETVEVPPIADAMIVIEHTHDHLQSLAANQWAKLEEQPDLDSAHEALLLREHYTELLRTDEVKQQPEGFQEMLAESESTAKQLEDLLMDWKKAGSPSPPPEQINKAFTAVTQSCASCHKSYRDVPLGEKAR